MGWPSLRSLPLCLAALALSLPAASGNAGSTDIDVSHRKLVFHDEFDSLSVSARSPGTRWTAHTPWGGDFGDAAFSDPAPGFPFTVANGLLRIELRRGPDGHWQSGLLASTDPSGAGFTLQYGYFEMRAKLPAGPGVWPAFWVDSVPAKGSADPSVEFDVIEQYGTFPGYFNSTVTVWPPHGHGAARARQKINAVPPGSLAQDFHTYGVDVARDWTVFYLDRHEIWRLPTPPEHRHGLTILADLGLGGGWPIDRTPNPSSMYVDYIRAWAPP